ncbi:MAG: chemotaxis protein CheA [Proteobacteria bacterium]|nr:chemotaxis protein CheA [Pseudomonadota bacterium]MBU4297102.1 chemotaxis protein CheA [Pseudomonadota bacterium]MCG2747401.1 chemotaxis protein CheA [Desulfobulbaceae bacterium]
METDIYKDIYKTEAIEILDDLEAALLELEDLPDDMPLIDRIFRALHTIKGSGKMFGFDDIADFTHEIENIYDGVRSGKLKVSQDLISLTLTSGDIIRRMVHAEEVSPAERQAMISRFQGIQQGEEKLVDETAGISKAREEKILPEKKQSAIWRVRFKPGRNIFQTGSNLAPLFAELRELGESTVVCHIQDVPGLAGLDPECCYLSWDIVLTTDRGEQAIRDVFIFVEDDSDIAITELEDADSVGQIEQHQRLGEILVEKGDIAQEKLAEILAHKPLIGQTLVQEKLVDQSSIKSALAEQQHIRKLSEKQKEIESSDSVRVAANKLDTLVNLVGELVIVQARLSQHSAMSHEPMAVSIAEEVERLTTELRDNTMSLRMLPIGTTFSKFKRLVRDLSKELGKEIVLEMEGEETQLDKSVIEQLNDPLIHIIRNSIDHGIESPQARLAQGKDKTGVIMLSATQSGADVVISIADDGAGLDAAKIRAKARERGLIAAGEELSEEEVCQLVFEPGFSTAEVVSDVSGRGVGMDVVKRGVEALRGHIEISSRRNEGTKITIRLPLTLAIIDGLLVETGGEMYVIPQAAVIECFEQTREDIENAHGNNVINVWGQMMPYICLRQRFDIAGDIPQSRRVILCEANGRKAGLAVDRVIGNYQTVIKPVGEIYKNIECISGATILGDGTVALILDPVKLLKEEQSVSLRDKIRTR